VVAEGVETPAQLEALRRLECHRAQGFLLSPPLTAEAAARLVGDAPQPAPGTDHSSRGEEQVA